MHGNVVTILILIDGFLQYSFEVVYYPPWLVTILILIDGFLQCIHHLKSKNNNKVTILILIDGFLQYLVKKRKKTSWKGHNPYFNRWFSAIMS